MSWLLLTAKTFKSFLHILNTYMPEKDTSFLEVRRLAFVKTEDWNTLKILYVKTEDFKIAWFEDWSFGDNKPESWRSEF